MSESQEQQKETVAPKKGKRSERREEALLVAGPAKPADAAPVEIKIAPDDVAASGPAQAPSRPRSFAYLAQAAVVLVALGIGWAGGHATAAMRGPAGNHAHESLMAIDWTGLASGLQKAQGDTMRMAADLQAMKGALAGLNEAAGRSRQDAAGRFGQLAERLDRIQMAGQEVAAKLAGVTERLETSEREANARLASAAERLDLIERSTSAQAAAAPKALLQSALQPPAAPPVPAAEAGLRTGSIPDQKAEDGKSEQPKAEAKAMPIEGWVLREVYDGVALIEGRNRRLVEVGPGEQVPGVGRVEAIERRGKRWVVVTAKGLIAMPR
jgi:hypothetical protein